MLTRPKSLVLLNLDEFVHRPEIANNVLAMTDMLCWGGLHKEYPMSLLNGSGSVVDLPVGRMGNSEVEPLHIGSGRYVPHELFRVDNTVKGGSFFESSALCAQGEKVKKNGKALRVLGVLSPDGLHGYKPQILALIEPAGQKMRESDAGGIVSMMGRSLPAAA